MKIANKLLIFFMILAVLLSVFLTNLWLMIESANQVSKTYISHHNSYKLAEELRRSSDDLTRMARTYVLTGKKEYKTYFDLIVKIRDGEQARPQNYDAIFWDFITSQQALELHQLAPERQVSIIELMKELNFSELELSLLAQAKQYSDNLINLEVKAFKLLEQQPVDHIDFSSNQKSAAALLFGDEYHFEKSRIMGKVDEFFRALNDRTSQQILVAEYEKEFHQSFALYLALFMLAYLIFSYLFFRKNAIKPLNEILNAIQKVHLHEYDLKLQNRKDEFGLLMNALKDMANEISRKIDELHHKSHTDVITSAFNRRCMLELLEKEQREIDRYHFNSSIIMIDIDHFKMVNDKHGHDVGDQVLMAFAKFVKERLRETDVFARWGGEEFMVLCPHTSYEDAKKTAESLCKKIRDSEFPVVQHVTASFGVGRIQENQTLEEAIKYADQALYKAKERGRNQVR